MITPEEKTQIEILKLCKKDITELISYRLTLVYALIQLAESWEKIKENPHMTEGLEHKLLWSENEITDAILNMRSALDKLTIGIVNLDDQTNYLANSIHFKSGEIDGVK